MNKYLITLFLFFVVANAEAKLDITDVKPSEKVELFEEEKNTITLINGRRMQPGGGSSTTSTEDQEESFWDQIIEFFS